LAAKNNIERNVSFTVNDARAYGNSVHADGLALYLPYYNTHLPMEFYMSGRDTQIGTSSPSFTKESLCALRAGMDTPTIDVFEGYSYGTYGSGTELPSVRGWFESLGEKQKWNTWNLSRAHVRKAYTQPPAWVNFDSTDRLAAYCGR
jgi:hypothetical protein